MALVTFILIFMYVPLLVLILNSFNESNISSWPIATFSVQWWEFAATYQPIRTALPVSYTHLTLPTKRIV